MSQTSTSHALGKVRSGSDVTPFSNRRTRSADRRPADHPCATVVTVAGHADTKGDAENQDAIVVRARGGMLGLPNGEIAIRYAAHARDHADHAGRPGRSSVAAG